MNKYRIIVSIVGIHTMVLAQDVLPKEIFHTFSQVLYLAMGSTKTPDIYTRDSFQAFKSGGKDLFLNRVFAHGPITDKQLADLISYFGVTPFSWWIHESQHTLSDYLESHGFIYQYTTPLMGMDLSALVFHTPAPTITVQHTTLKDTTAVTKWAYLAAQGFNLSEQDIHTFLQYIYNNSSITNVHLYSGLIDDLPVASGITIEHADSSITIHLLSTIKKYRRLGLCSAITYQALQDAQAKGFKKAFLLASDKGLKLYKSIGFTEFSLCKVYAYTEKHCH